MNCCANQQVAENGKVTSQTIPANPLEKPWRMRFGFALLKHLCETHQTELLVMNTEALSPEQELVQDLMTITHCFSSRLYGLRNYRKALEKALKDENRAPDPDESHA